MSETEILWDLPLSRGMAYMHAAMCREGVDMQWSGGQPEQDEAIQKTVELIKKLRRR